MNNLKIKVLKELNTKNKKEKTEKNFFHYFSNIKYKKIIVLLVFIFVSLFVVAELAYVQNNSPKKFPENLSGKQRKNKEKIKLNPPLQVDPDITLRPKIIFGDIQELGDDFYIGDDNTQKQNNVSKERDKIIITVPSGIRLTLEVAADSVSRQLGLMFRKSLNRNSGMIFVFSDYEQRSFWMRNTSIALSIAYLDKDGVVLQIEDMVPFSTLPVRSYKKAKYAIEVNKGAFASYGITIGTPLDVPEGVSDKLSINNE